MRALITGVGGFVGRHLARHLLEQGDAVWGVAHVGGPAPVEGVEVVAADLRDRSEVDSLVRRVHPEAVYHLAAQSSSTESLSDPWHTIANNLRAQMNLLEAAVAAELRPRTLVVGSSEEYGHLRPQDIPTHEDVPLRPITPYAVSKVGQDVMGYQYYAQHGLPIIRVRPFSHTGPGHDARFVIPSFAKQIAEIEAGLRPPSMNVGNLDAYRDFTDVRDIVRAYRIAVVLGVPGEVYNLGRGTSVRVGDVLDDLIGLCNVKVEVLIDPHRLRPSDVPRQQADTTKFRSLTGWAPGIPWQQTLSDTLDYWRECVATEAARALERVRGSTP